jgi:hypothetical protein
LLSLIFLLKNKTTDLLFAFGNAKRIDRFLARRTKEVFFLKNEVIIEH